MTPIIVTPRGTACPVAPAPDTPVVERRIADMYDTQAAITLAQRPDVLRKVLLGSVPRRKTDGRR